MIRIFIIAGVLLSVGCEIRSEEQVRHDKISGLERSYQWVDCRETVTSVQKDKLKYASLTCPHAFHVADQQEKGGLLILKCRCDRTKLTEAEVKEAEKSAKAAIKRLKTRPKDRTVKEKLEIE